jgi:hypothetical protein
MMLGLSAVHMLAGGYSATSRHQYAPLALLLLFVGWVWCRLVPTGAFDSIRAWFPGLLAGTYAFGVVSTWLVVGTNRFELKRHHAIIRFARDQRIQRTTYIVYEPAAYALWPRMRRTFSHDYTNYGNIDLGLLYFGATPLEDPKTANAPKIKVSGILEPYVIQQLEPK